MKTTTHTLTLHKTISNFYLQFAQHDTLGTRRDEQHSRIAQASFGYLTELLTELLAGWELFTTPRTATSEK